MLYTNTNIANIRVIEEEQLRTFCFFFNGLDYYRIRKITNNYILYLTFM